MFEILLHGVWITIGFFVLVILLGLGIAVKDFVMWLIARRSLRKAKKSLRKAKFKLHLLDKLEAQEEQRQKPRRN